MAARPSGVLQSRSLTAASCHPGEHRTSLRAGEQRVNSGTRIGEVAVAAPHLGIVDAATIILVLVIVTALAFDFTNGFHDTANAMATSIATGALRPKVAVGAVRHAQPGRRLPVRRGGPDGHQRGGEDPEPDGTPKPELLADGGDAVLLIVLAGLVGGIVWNLFTWLLGLPSSSSHALFGGLIGASDRGPGVGRGELDR